MRSGGLTSVALLLSIVVLVPTAGFGSTPQATHIPIAGAGNVVRAVEVRDRSASSATGSAGTLVLANGTYLPYDYDASWANIGGIRSIGWDPVSDELWAAGMEGFEDNVGATTPVAQYNITTGELGAPLDIGGGGLGTPVLPTAFIYDASAGRIDLIDQGTASVQVLNATSHPAPTVIATIPLGGGPAGAAIDGATGMLWVADDLAGRVDVVNVTNRSFVHFPLPLASSVAFDARANQMFVGSLENLSIYNASTATRVAVLSLPAVQLAVDPGAGTVYASSGSQNVSEVSAPSDVLVTNISLGPGEETEGVAYDPALPAILVANPVDDSIAVIAPSGPTLIENESLGTSPSLLAVDPTEGAVAVACPATNALELLNATTLAPAKTVQLGGLPSAVYQDEGSGDLLLPDPQDQGVWTVTTSPTPAVAGFLPTEPFEAGWGGLAWDPALARSILAIGDNPNLTELSGSPPTVVGTWLAPFPVNDLAFDAANASLAVIGPTSVGFLNDTTGSLVANVTLPGASGGLFGGESIAFDPSTGDLYALVGGDYGDTPGEVYAIDGTTHALLGNATVGPEATCLALDPAGGRVFVGEDLYGNVSVLNASGLALLDEFPVPGAFGHSDPTALAYSTATTSLYVTESDSGDLLTYSGMSLALVDSYSAEADPDGVLYNATDQSVFVASAGSSSLHVFHDLAGPLITSFTADPSIVAVGNESVLRVTATGGAPPLNYTYSNLPPGCHSANQSDLDCFPSAAGVFSVEVSVADSAGATRSASTTLTVLGASASVTFEVDFSISPVRCGPITVGGTAYANGSVGKFVVGSYPMSVASCSGTRSYEVQGDGNVTANASTLTVAGNGSVDLVYALATLEHFVVRVIVTPSPCASSVLVNGTDEGPNTTVLLAAGTYPISAAVCVGQLLVWNASGGVGVTGSSILVSGNGTLTATYHPAGGTSSPLAPSPIELLVLAVVVLIAALVGGFVIARRRRSPPPEPAEGPVPPVGTPSIPDNAAGPTLEPPSD
jgi:DNA-binding beta-propeller fold protein YncE